METQTPDEQHTQGSTESDNRTVSRQDASIQAYPSTESKLMVMYVHVHIVSRMKCVCACVTSNFLCNTGDEVNDINGLQLYKYLGFHCRCPGLSYCL